MQLVCCIPCERVRRDRTTPENRVYKQETMYMSKDACMRTSTRSRSRGRSSDNDNCEAWREEEEEQEKKKNERNKRRMRHGRDKGHIHRLEHARHLWKTIATCELHQRPLTIRERTPLRMKCMRCCSRREKEGVVWT